MAKVKGLLASGLRGKVGDIVYRKRNGKTHAYVLKVKNNPQSPKQKERQAKLAQASVWLELQPQPESTVIAMAQMNAEMRPQFPSASGNPSG